MSRKALGKGLEAIFGNIGTEVVSPETGESVHDIELTKIKPNPFQPRLEFNPEEIKELAESIREKGILQPVLLRRHGNEYQLVAGERRFRATQSLQLKTIKALVRESLSDRDMMEIALIENLQRVQLNPIEEAIAYEKLIDECGLTHEVLATKMSKSRSAITNTLRLLKLHEEVQTFIREGKITAGHGRALLNESPAKQIILARKIIDKNLNVRATEKNAQHGLRTIKPIKGSPSNPHINAFTEKMRHYLGTKVEIKGSENKGILEIHYMSRQDLENLGNLIKKGFESGV